jgi:hypothetical protein
MFGRFVRVRAHRRDPEATICVVAEPEVDKGMISCHLPTFECCLVPGMTAYQCAADEGILTGSRHEKWHDDPRHTFARYPVATRTFRHRQIAHA